MPEVWLVFVLFVFCCPCCCVIRVALSFRVVLLLSLLIFLSFMFSINWFCVLCGSLKVLFHLCDLELSDVARKSWVLRRSVLAVVVIYVPSEFFGSCWWALVAFWLGCCLFRCRTPSPCLRWIPIYDLGCVSASEWRRCPCFVVGLHLSLDLCLCSFQFLGEVVWQRSLWLQPSCLALVLAERWCCSGGGGDARVVVM